MIKIGLLATTACRSLALLGCAMSAAAPAYAQAVQPQPTPQEGVTEAAPPETLGQNEVELEAGQDANTDEDIVVTGSRIRRPNLESSIPITSIGVQELTDSGNLAIGDELNDLPALRSTFSQSNSTRFIGTAGLNILDLRGLGTERTLVLVNGRRHVSSTPGNFRVDVNTIPTDLIERVDIVTGGNSAIYGSDAVAGVVNFILKRDFEGIRVRGQGGISDEKDRGSYFASITAGKNFADNRGNVAVAFEYAKLNQVFAAQRDDQTGAVTGGPAFITTDDTTGEPASGDGIFDLTFFPDRVRPNTNSIGGFFASVCPAPPGPNATPAQIAAINARRASNCTGTFLPPGQGGSEIANNFVFLPDGSLVVNQCEVDFRPLAGSNNCIGGQGRTTLEGDQLFPGLTRYAANLLASFEVSDAFQPFLEAKYVRIDSLESGQPTFLGGTLPGVFRLDNPFLSEQARSVLRTALPANATTFTMRRFNTDFGFRSEVTKRQIMRVVGGVEGSFNDDWRYEATLNYGRTEIDFTSRNSTLIQEYRNAVDARRLPNGNIVCGINADANPANDDPACVPLNLFGSGAPSQAALDYISYDPFADSLAEQVGATAFVSGDLSQLFELPGGPIGFAVGAEYRSEKASVIYDPISSDPRRLTFFNVFAPFTPPKLEVKEAFGEVRVPLLADRPFFHELTLEASGRLSDYNRGSTGTVFAYNVSGIWAPVRDIRFRGGYAKSVRAPTLSDLFNTQTTTFFTVRDPCDQRFINENPNRAANCAAAGVPTTIINPANGQVIPFTNVASSTALAANRGNPALREEVGKSLTVGFVSQPRFLPGFSLSLDYYDITIENVIFTLGAATVINQCYDDPGGIDNPFCAVVNRRTSGPFAGTFTGQTTQVIAGVTYEIPGEQSPSTFGQPFNYAKLETSGIDVEAAYRTRLMGNAVLNLRGLLSWVDKKNTFSVVTDPTFADRLLGEVGDPEWEASFKANLDLGMVALGYDLRWIDKATIGDYEAQNSVQGRPPENADLTEEVYYPDVFYHDIRVEIEPNEQYKFYMGIDNVTDRLPPFDLLGTGGGSGIYNTLGRFFYAGAEVKF